MFLLRTASTRPPWSTQWHIAIGQFAVGLGRFSRAAAVILTLNACTSGVAQQVTFVAAGEKHTAFVKPDGTLWAMGSDDSGQIGAGVETGPPVGSRPRPTFVALGVTSVALGRSHTLFIKTDGTLWATGANYAGQLGDGTNLGRNIPVQIATGVASVSAGSLHTMFIKSDKTLWAVGSNSYGQLGDGTTADRNVPTQVATGVVAVSAGGGHTMFIKTDGSLWAMGLNTDGQLGDRSTTNRSTAVQVASDVVSVSTGSSHTMFIKADGALWSMGSNAQGQLGADYLTSRNFPLPYSFSSRVVSVAAGANHTMFVMQDGTLWGTGSDAYSQLGDGAFGFSDRRSPVRITGGVASVTAGGFHTLFVKTDGTLWGMGSNYQGQLGPIFAAYSNVPIRVEDPVIIGPAFTRVALGQIVTPGQSVTLFVQTYATSLITYQWFLNGNPIIGATSPTYAIPQVTDKLVGNYTVVITDAWGSSVTSPVAAVTFPPTYLVNLSVRAQVGPGEQNLIVGFGLSDEGATKPMLLRAIGPTLAGFGVTNALVDPKLEVFSRDGTKLAENDNWGGTSFLKTLFQLSAAFPLSPDTSLDAALSTGISSRCTAKVSGADNATGVALVEVYDGLTAIPHLTNISTRAQVGTGGDALIAGLTITGMFPKKYLIRAVGPSLAAFGVSGTLSDPVLTVNRLGSAEAVATNDDWSGTTALKAAFVSVGAFPFSSDFSKDAALTLELSPGSYTAVVSGKNNSTGVALIEVYELP